MFFDDIIGGLKHYAVWLLERATERSRQRGHSIDPRIIEASATVRRYLQLEADADDLILARSSITAFLEERFPRGEDSDEPNYYLAHAAADILRIDDDLETALSIVDWLRGNVLPDDIEADRELALRLRAWADEAVAYHEGRTTSKEEE